MKATDSTNSRGHEGKDADVISLFMIGTLVIITCVIAGLASWGIMHLLDLRHNAGERPARSMSSEQPKFPQPRMLARPADDLRHFREQESLEMQTYGWIDRPAGVVRIPIQQAMHLLIERGLPETGAGMTPLQLMQQRPQTNETPNSAPGSH